MKVTPAQKADIKRLAQKRGQSATTTVLDLVQRALEEEEEIVAEPGSFLAALEGGGARSGSAYVYVLAADRCRGGDAGGRIARGGSLHDHVGGRRPGQRGLRRPDARR